MKVDRFLACIAVAQRGHALLELWILVPARGGLLRLHAVLSEALCDLCKQLRLERAFLQNFNFLEFREHLLLLDFLLLLLL